MQMITSCWLGFFIIKQALEEHKSRSTGLPFVTYVCIELYPRACACSSFTLLIKLVSSEMLGRGKFFSVSLATK